MADTNFITKKSDGAGSLFLDIGTLGADTHVLVGHNLSPVEIAVTTTATATLNRWHRCTGTSADYAVTLPACANNAGKLIGFIMDAALTKLVTLDGNSAETIDGATTRIMWANETCILRVNDAGTAWEKIGGKSIPMRADLAYTANQTFNAGVVTKVALATANSRFTASNSTMADTANNRIIAKRPGSYNLCLELFWNNTNSSINTREEITPYLDGVSWGIPQGCYTAASIHHPHGGVWTINLAAAGYVELWAYYNAGSFTTSCFIDAHMTLEEILTW